MKARVIRDDIELLSAPDQLSREWKELTVVREIMRNGAMIPRAFWKYGAIIDLPDCWMAVQMGWAEPADDECHARSGRMTRAQLDRAQMAYNRVSRGIHPDDYARFDRGEMTGYAPDGSDIPGPNWKPPAPEADDDADDEEDSE